MDCQPPHQKKAANPPMVENTWLLMKSEWREYNGVFPPTVLKVDGKYSGSEYPFIGLQMYGSFPVNLIGNGDNSTVIFRHPYEKQTGNFPRSYYGGSLPTNSVGSYYREFP
ncbi:hypothetical protein OUZ56_024125 [Daphnia magna]|uniref:Uncharacterized protein n=1 Tax=Daphnia magna TaxID=35525 RepID=A0ABR0B075_9CRUS|nr:hypothetical protein OUZ56_024125 [Daphnia magna]